jgi:alginate O-acetyltransferase complex protein AlgI
MLFTSFTFVLFLVLVFILYWFVFNRDLKVQNLFLVISSYIFYGWWDWRFLFLLFFISVSNYLIGILIQKTEQRSNRKLFFFTGLIINIGTLVLFKYFNFFIDGFINLISIFGFKVNALTLRIILPLGISFYIFLSLSYIIDIYQYKFTAVRNFINALLTFSFFPIILAGPIQRPISLLPQIQTLRIFNYSIATNGLKQILWGAFMKIVIADNCNILVNPIFTNYSTYSGSTLVLGVFLFTIQIYADFAGYSNIAIGLGKLLGFNIMQNFAYPYFSRDIREFWKRWNISLTTWFRDYVFLPLAYSVSRSIKSDRLYFIKTEFLIYTIGITATWLLTGLWHGARTTFIIWGLLHGFYLVINHITAKPRKRMLKKLNIRTDNIILRIVDSLATFIIIMFSWVFFRSDNIGIALGYISEIFSGSVLTIPEFSRMKNAIAVLFLIGVFLVIEWIGREQQFPIARLGFRWPKIVRWGFYYGIIMIIIYFASSEQQFIYFQF